MNQYLEDGSLGRFLAFWKVFIQATFSYGGSEMVVVAAGETENPRRNVPKAVRRVFWRIAIFYVGSVFLVGLCVSSQDPRLLNAIHKGAAGVGASPFVIAIENGGILVLPSIINAVVLTSALSAGNSFFYASTRILYATALDGKAPRFLQFEKFGVPYACVIVTAALSLLVYLNVSSSSVEVFFLDQQLELRQHVDRVDFYRLHLCSFPPWTGISRYTAVCPSIQVPLPAIPGLFCDYFLVNCGIFQRVRCFLPWSLQCQELHTALH